MTTKKGIDIGLAKPLAAPGPKVRKRPRRTPAIYCPGADLEPGRQLVLRNERLSRRVIVWLIHG
jgi:hypothetical protein